MLSSVVRSLYLLVLTCWAGATVFFSLYVLPTLFVRLETEQAGDIAVLLFPGYYIIGTALGALLLTTCAYMAWRGAPGRRGWRLAAAVAAVMLACQAYATVVVHPQMSGLRDAPEQRPAFDRLHKTSVRLNLVVLVGGLVLVVASAGLLARDD